MQSSPPHSKAVLLLTLSSLALFARAADYPTTVTSLSPVAYYRFSETTPAIGNTATNHGTAGALGNGVYVNDDLTGVAPIHGATAGALVASTNPCITATGTTPPNDSFMQVPFNNAINPTGPFTAEAWIQPSAAPAGLTCFMSYGHIENPGNAPNRSGWLIYQDNGASSGGGGLNFRMYNHNGLNRALTLTGGEVPNPGSWYHVAIVYDGTNAFLYFNGNQVASGQPAGYVPPLDGNFSVGTRGDNSFQYSGLIDEVALYTNALAASVILSHYQNGTNASPATPYESLIGNSNPLLYYRFDEPPVITPATLPTTANLGTGGSALDATIDVGMTTAQPGVTYPGFSSTNVSPYFNGLLGDIIISNPPASLNNGAVTFTAWIKRQGPADSSQGAFGGGWAGIVFQRGTAKATGLSFGDYNDLHYNWEDNAAAYNFVPTPRMVIPDEVWSFVAGVFTPTQTVLCLNGMFATNVVANAAHDFTTDPIFIGQDPNSGFRFVQGYIDEVALFDKALTQAQLLQLFNAGGMTPIITVQPQAPTGTIYEGFSASFTVQAIGGQPLAYQWTKNGANISGQTGTTLSFPNLVASDSGNYAAVVTNAFGSVTSSIVSLTVVAGPPILTAVPASISRYPGGTADFSVAAVGTTPITYQWYAGSNAITGATGPALQINQLQASDVGTYSVTVSNPHGTTNVTATLTLASLSTAPAYVNAVLTRNPIAYWRLNETNGSTAFDFQGGLDGTFNPLTTHAGSPGPVPPAFTGFEAANTSFSFDGNTSDIMAPPLNVNNDAATVVLMMQPQGLPPTDFYGIVFERNSGSDVSGLNFRTGGDLGYTWNGDPNSYNWDSGLLPLTNQWNFVALVVQPDQATIYLDSGKGMTTATNVIAHGAAAWGAPTHLGTDPLGNRIYQGLLDEVAVYNYALSPTQIQALHDAAFIGTFTALQPSIVLQPVSQGLLQGDSYTLAAQATGSQPLTYQWTKDNLPIAGAIRDTLPFASATLADAGTYRWVVTQGSISVTSAPAVITVDAIPTGVNLTNDLVVHLKLDNDFSDSSGRGNNAVAVGSPPFVTGKLGKGAHLNSTGSSGGNFLSLPDTSGDLMLDVTNDFSVALWLRYTTDFNDLPVIGNAVNSTYQKGWVITEDGNKFEWSLVGDDVGQAIADPVGGPLINDGNWHNLVLVVDRSNVVARSYVDGTQIDLRSIAGLGTLITGTTVTLGQDPTGTYGVGGAFDIDDVGIWRRALSRVEAESIYFAGQNGNSFDSVVTNLPPVTMSIQNSAGSIVIKWSNGTLESSTNAGSGYLPVQGASAPSYTVPLPLGAAKFYRVKVQ